MIITDPSIRPSQRFIDILLPYFSQQDYTLRAGLNEFRRQTKEGFETVSFRFYVSTLVSVDFSWAKSFLPLEKIVAFINGHPNKYKTEFTLRSDLMNYFFVSPPSLTANVRQAGNPAWLHRRVSRLMHNSSE